MSAREPSCSVERTHEIDPSRRAASSSVRDQWREAATSFERDSFARLARLRKVAREVATSSERAAGAAARSSEIGPSRVAARSSEIGPSRVAARSWVRAWPACEREAQVESSSRAWAVTA